MDDAVDLSELNDADAARAIRRHGIDVLIDIGGYSADARPGILLHRPAPVQASYLGYPSTLGMAGMDYLICDHYVVPEEFGQHYREQLVRLPECFMPYDTSRSVAATTPSRSQERLPETALVLCSFNASWKIHPLVFEVWMRLLVQLPNSVLWLRDGEGVPDNLRREAAANGVSPERLVFARREPDGAAHLARQSLADLFLDTWPYNAHQTACDALWAGLPVLTCPGRSFPSRVAGSLLRTAGVPELVCESLEHYERRALELARDRAQLQKLRERIRAARVTPLFDMPRLCRHLEQAYSLMWECHERGEPPRGFSVTARPRGPDNQSA
jgi:predicted O-linked N-acetylglucosamine transferase (SPINDLY family)